MPDNKSQRDKAIAAATLMRRAVCKTEQLEMRECSLLLRLIIDALCVKFRLQEHELRSEDAHTDLH